MRAVDKYTMFHGKQPHEIRPVKFHVPKNFILLGEAVAIEYKCKKINGGGTGRVETFRHVFETSPILCMDEKAKGQLYILGDKVKVTKEGIEN